MNQNSRFSDRFDWTLCFLLLLFFLISCIAIYSGQSSNQYEGNFVISQIKNYIVGAVIVGIVMYFDSEQIRRLTWLLYGLGILLLVGLFIAPESIAPERKGATLWYIIPGLGSVQPSEFVKVFLIIALSKIIADHHLKYQAKTAGTDFFS